MPKYIEVSGFVSVNENIWTELAETANFLARWKPNVELADFVTK
jgi:hypothetical protein